MRAPYVIVLGLFSLSCSDSLAPAADVQGTWAAEFHMPGSSLVLELTETDGAVSGTGTYAIEAGRAGDLQVVGTYARPDITLSFTYDSGAMVTFSGTVLASRRMTGQTTDSAGRVGPLAFTRR